MHRFCFISKRSDFEKNLKYFYFVSIFLCPDTCSLNIGFLSVLGLGLFQLPFQIHSFSNNDIVFPAEAEYFTFLPFLG